MTSDKSTDGIETKTAEVELTWSSKREWGSEGLTHRATAEINGEQWKFEVQQPVKGTWTVRGWRDGDFAFYRGPVPTMREAKRLTKEWANVVRTSTCPECRKVLGHKMDCWTGRAAAERAATVRRAAAEGVAALDGFVKAFRKPLPCGCPTPTHRMSCGEQARPQVVAR